MRLPERMVEPRSLDRNDEHPGSHLGDGDLLQHRASLSQSGFRHRISYGTIDLAMRFTQFRLAGEISSRASFAASSLPPVRLPRHRMRTFACMLHIQHLA